MEEEMDDKIMILTKRLFNHIHSLTVRERISTWSLDDCPEVKTGDPKQIYQELITTRLQAEIVLWYNEGNISSELENGIKAFEDYLLKLERDFNISRENVHKKSGSENEKFSSVYSKHGKREVPSRNFFQWIFSIASYFSNLSQRWRCNKDRFKYMKECTEAVLSNLSKADLSEIITADLVIVHENISSTFEQFLQNEYSFLKELESAPALPGNNKTMETIKSSCVTLLEEVDLMVF